MAFEVDAQTTTDLGIFSNGSTIPDIFSIYNSTKTFGGMVCLKEMMGESFENQEEILERSDTIRFFYSNV